MRQMQEIMRIKGKKEEENTITFAECGAVLRARWSSAMVLLHSC